MGGRPVSETLAALALLWREDSRTEEDKQSICTGERRT